MPEHSLTELEFVDATVGMNIPKTFIPSIEKVRNYYLDVLVSANEFIKYWLSLESLPESLMERRAVAIFAS